MTASMSFSPICPRFEPLLRSDGVEEGLAARLADPLWMLARQWQFGEFRGDDAGTPVTMNFAATAHHPTWWRPEPDATQPAAHPYASWNVTAGPLETRIEAEPDDGTAAHRRRLDGGVRARRALLAAGLPGPAARLLTLAPFTAAATGGATNALDAACLAAVPDPLTLTGLISPWADPSAPPSAAALAAFAVDPADTQVFADTLRGWLRWWLTRAPAGPGPDPNAPLNPPAWDPHRLEHRGSLAFASAPKVRLQIDRHPGGPLDWYSADIRIAAPADLASAPTPPPGLNAAVPITASGVPQRATFAGMPATRFWEFEDARVDYSSIDASGADLARLLLIEYTTVYDHDWYTVPLKVPVGALVQADGPVTVTDSFGETFPLEPFAAKPGAHTRIYTLNAPDPGSSPDWNTRWFWFAPRLPAVLDGEPLESADLHRDEVACLAWAVQTTVADPFGRASVRRGQPGASQPPLPAGAALRYTVESAVTDNWYPLVPTPISGTALTEPCVLVLEPRPQDPPGHLLGATDNSPGATAPHWWIHEQELSRAGVTLARRLSGARWHDGRLYRWTNRSGWLGGGEATSGLTWDYLS
jgi:hypothetical protein